MKILYSWLKDFIDLDLTPEEMVQNFVHLGIEVASVETTAPILKAFTWAKLPTLRITPTLTIFTWWIWI